MMTMMMMVMPSEAPFMRLKNAQINFG